MNTHVPALALALALLAAGCHRDDAAATADTGAMAPAATVASPAVAPADTSAMPAPAATGMNAAAAPDAAQSADQRFLGEAMRSNEDEIAVTALAMDKGGAKVKPLATMLNKDHVAMRDKLAAVANGATAAAGSAPADLASLSGDAFDTRVLGLLREAHESAVALFSDASKNVALSDDVRKLAADALPTLQGHLDKVKAAQGKE